MVEHRDPYPNWREKTYWLYKKYVKREDIPPKAWVKLSCPDTDTIIATEHTDPVDVERDVQGGTQISTYECPNCEADHRWLWGPPAPIRLSDVD